MPKAVDEAFYSREPTKECPFCLNDSIEVLRGPFAGHVGAVISIESTSPEVTLLVELGDGRDVTLPASILRRCSTGARGIA